MAEKITKTYLLSCLAEYHKYIKEHYKSFVNKYDGDMTTFSKAKSAVKSGKKVRITCVGPLRWALYSMGLKNGDGKYLISAPQGSFGKYYTGGIKKHFKRIKSGGPVGKTPKQAIDKGLLKPADIVCYKNITHTSVYSGSGYRFYEGGGQCVKDGHYPNGILMDYNKNYYKDKKISEVLRLIEVKPVAKKPAATKPATTTTTKKKTPQKYTGKIPEFSKKRPYYMKGDGISTLKDKRIQIKRIQRALNWAVNAKLKVDGQYGENTKKAVNKFKKLRGLTQSGKWGRRCNAKLKTMKK